MTLGAIVFFFSKEGVMNIPGMAWGDILALIEERFGSGGGAVGPQTEALVSSSSWGSRVGHGWSRIQEFAGYLWETLTDSSDSRAVIG